MGTMLSPEDAIEYRKMVSAASESPELARYILDETTDERQLKNKAKDDTIYERNREFRLAELAAYRRWKGGRAAAEPTTQPYPAHSTGAVEVG